MENGFIGAAMGGAPQAGYPSGNTGIGIGTTGSWKSGIAARFIVYIYRARVRYLFFLNDDQFI